MLQEVAPTNLHISVYIEQELIMRIIHSSTDTKQAGHSHSSFESHEQSHKKKEEDHASMP